MAAKGNDLFLIARNNDGLSEAAKEIMASSDVKVEYFACDLTAADSTRKIAEKLKSKKVNILVNNAGIGDYANFVDADLNKLDSMMQLNIVALVDLSHLLVPNMLRVKDAKILNVASTAAFFPGPRMAVYYASKAFVLSFSQALSFELRDTNVKVTVLCPGPTATKFDEVARASKSSFFRNPASLASAEQVVAYAIKSMENGELISIPGGWMQKLMLQAPRILPRKSIAGLVARIQNRH